MWPAYISVRKMASFRFSRKNSRIPPSIFTFVNPDQYLGYNDQFIKYFHTSKRTPAGALFVHYLSFFELISSALYMREFHIKIFHELYQFL